MLHWQRVWLAAKSLIAENETTECGVIIPKIAPLHYAKYLFTTTFEINAPFVIVEFHSATNVNPFTSLCIARYFIISPQRALHRWPSGIEKRINNAHYHRRFELKQKIFFKQPPFPFPPLSTIIFIITIPTALIPVLTLTLTLITVIVLSPNEQWGGCENRTHYNGCCTFNAILVYPLSKRRQTITPNNWKQE